MEINNINFEGLGIYLKINRVACKLYGFKIYWYSLFIVLSFIITLLLCKKDDGKYNIKFENIMELVVFAIPISIIFARIYYVVFNFSTFAKNPVDIINIRNGGLAIYGGIIGAILTTVLYCKIKKISIPDMLDYLIPFMPLGQAIGRWGNFFNCEAYGYETTNILRMGLTINGKYIQVHPTFLYESICTFIVFIALYLKRNKRKYSGELTLLYFLMYGIIRTVIEGLRADSLMIGNLRVSQVKK